MTQVKLNDILNQIETLEVEELRELNRAIQERLTPRDERYKRATFHRALLSAGLVKKIPKPRIAAPIIERPIIKAQGESVSQTIITERR